MPQPYISPGGAFSNAFSDSLLQDAALKRQAMLDSLHQRQVESEIAQGQAALEEKRQEHTDQVNEKERLATVNEVAGLVKGDIPDAGLVERAKKHHVTLRTEADLPAPIPAQFGTTATDVTGGVRFAGSPKQAEEDTARQRARTFIDSLPDSDPRKQELKQAFEAEAAGLKVPAGYFSKTAASDIEPVYRQNPRTGAVEKVGEVPKGSHFMTEPPPKDTSAKDDREAAHADSVRQQAFQEFDKWSTPIQSQIEAFDNLGVMLNARTPEADRLIAPLVIKGTIAGQGSGFRMTRSEIEQVAGGRSHWEALQAALNQWNLDPTKALSITDEQRKELRDLAKAIRSKATKRVRDIHNARVSVTDADGAKDVNRARNRLYEDLFSGDETDPTAAPATRIRYDMQGRPIPAGQ